MMDWRAIVRIRLLALLLLLTGPAVAQSPDALYAEGRQAMQEGRYEEARRILDGLVQGTPDHAEGHYLLARLYTETPLADRRMAERALDKALDIEPDNVTFLTANLLQLRTDSWNFFAEQIKEIKRIELARRILALDPDNAFAHEELGASHIRDFWRYRNAVMIPMMQHGWRQMDATQLAEQRDDGLGVVQAEVYNLGYRSVDPRQVFLADHFDLEALETLGITIEDVSGRAARAYELAVEHLEKALASDARRRSVYDHLMRIHALKGAYAAALPMLGEMNVFFADDPMQWMYLGLAQYQLGDLQRADESFDEGLARLAEEDRLVFERVDLIIPEPERASYLADPERYAERFWHSKDPRYLTRFNERKLEHFSRLVYADLLYSAPDLDLRGWETERGRILVRYGLPKFDVTVIPRSSRMASGDILMDAITNAGGRHEDPGAEAPREASISSPTRFDRARLEANYQLFDELNTFNIWDYGDFKFVFEDPYRNGAYRLYSPPATHLAAGMDGWLNDYQILARQTFREIPERYEYESPARQIELPFVANAFKGSDGLADLYVHFGVPIAQYGADQDMIRVTANTGTFLISGDREILEEKRRTVYGLATDQILPFRETNLWVDSEHLHAPAGRHEVSVEFESASGATVAVQRRAVEVPNFSEREDLMLSDMMLAYQITEAMDGVGPADITRDGLAITPAPWSVFRKDGPIYLYFEAYGLTLAEDATTSYDVEILLRPKQEASGLRRVFGGLFGGARGVSVTYTGSGTQRDDGQYQILDASGVDPGLYTLSLRVRDNVSGKSASTEKDLFVE